MRSKTASIWPGTADIHRQEDRSFDLPRQRLDMGLGLVVEIGDRELGAERAEGARAAPCDRAVVGDADDQALAAVKQLGGDVGEGHGGSWLISVGGGRRG